MDFFPSLKNQCIKTKNSKNQKKQIRLKKRTWNGIQFTLTPSPNVHRTE